MTPSVSETPIAVVEAASEFPRYQCKRVVQAVKIKTIVLRPVVGRAPEVVLVPDDPAHGSFTVPIEFVTKFHPTPGMYYVLHEDGFQSASPADVFEAGYVKV